MAKNKNLEGKLRAIQELKSQKYIGTQEAWHYVDRVAALYDNPVKIAKAINEELEKNREVYFKATPERIMGLGHFYEKVIFDFRDESEKLDNECPGFKDSSALSNYWILIFGKKERLSPVEEKVIEKRDPEKLANYLIPIFRSLQSPRTTNTDYCICAIDYNLDKISVDEKTKESILAKVSSANCDYICSPENLVNIEKEIKEIISLDEINVLERIDRMYRDQVDHRLENRREILVDYIDVLIGCGYNKEQISYDFLRELLLKRLETSKKRFKIFQELNYPKQVLSNEEEMIKESEFLITAIAPEKNFINRYLRS